VIFGGTFDPIHEGHLSVIRTLLVDYERVIIAPTGQNPWKPEQATPFAMRFHMIALVLESEGIRYSERIKDRGLILYNSPYLFSVDLLKELRRKGYKALTWAVGADNAASVSEWRDWSTLGCPVVTIPVTIDRHASAVREGRELLHPALKDYVKLNRLYTAST